MTRRKRTPALHYGCSQPLRNNAHAGKDIVKTWDCTCKVERTHIVFMSSSSWWANKKRHDSNNEVGSEGVKHAGATCTTKTTTGFRKCDSVHRGAEGVWWRRVKR